MLTLDEAIIHAEEKAEENKSKAEEFHNEGLATSSENYRLCCFEDYVKCTQCAEEHKQLAEWLKQLQEVKKIVDDWHTIRNIQDANDAMADYFNQILEVLKGGKG
jgi:hypothetical protein